MKKSTRLLLTAAALAGLHSGLLTAGARAADKAGTPTEKKDPADKHDCKGKNACKGHGGCKSGDNGCKGKNSCKGKGGCATTTGKTDGTKKS
jgi:hypothetical protein